MVVRAVTRDDVAKYCDEIKKSLIRNGLDVSCIYPSIRSDIESFVAECPIVTMEGLVERFGRPEDYVRACIESMSLRECRKVLDYARFRRNVCLTAATIIVLVVVIAALGVIFRVDSNAGYYYMEYIMHK